jgi:glycosyltransferase involved in cell wall biosynthesis
MTALSVKKARKVIFPSAKARSDVERLTGILRHATVIHHGIDKHLFYPQSENNRMRDLRKKYGLNKFILFVSHIQRYKNFKGLIEAFLAIKGTIDNDMQLVFAGECLDKGYFMELKTLIKSQGLEDTIIFLGNIPYEDLPYLYSACDIFVYPSLCESFGMTLVEAMSCGAPVLVSRREPMTEICADAALYFDPTNPAEIAETISKTLDNQELMKALREMSLKRAESFSWESTALRTLKIIKDTKSFGLS